MLLMIGGAVLLGAAGLAAWFGCFRSVQISEDRFRGGVFFYRDYQGSINAIGKGFDPICVDRETIFGKGAKGACIFGVYYDSPNDIKKPEHLRACVGLLVNKELLNSETEKSFSDRSYKKRVLPDALSLYGKFPARTSLSFAIGAMKYYPALSKRLQQDKDKYPVDMSQDRGALELMEGNWIHYYFPIENVKDFLLSPYPRPERKSEAITKKTI